MWIQDVDRATLTDIVQKHKSGSLPVRAREVRDVDDAGPPNAELRLIWTIDPKLSIGLPAAVVVPNGSIRDFLAWVITYLPDVKPFTANCRVLDHDSLLAGIEYLVPPTLGRLQSACVGVILGETATYLSGRSDGTFSIGACASTLSYALAMAYSRRCDWHVHVRAAENWKTARSVTGQRELSLSKEDILGVWAVIQYLSSELPASRRNVGSLIPPEIVDVCSRIHAGEDVLWQAADFFHRLAIDPVEIEGISLAPREYRIVQLERALATLARPRKRDPLLRAFFGGFLTSLVAPGTFDHHAVLAAYADRLPGILMWYGLCAGLHAATRLHQFQNGLGYRIIRDVQRYDRLLESPRCDIAAFELEMLAYSNATGRVDVRSPSSGQIEIELVPTINTLLKWPIPKDISRDKPTAVHGRQQRLFDENRDPELQNLLFDLDNALGRVDQLRDRLTRLLNLQAEKSKKRRRIQ